MLIQLNNNTLNPAALFFFILCFVLIVNTRKVDALQSQTSALCASFSSTSRVPLPPWSFTASKIKYQFKAIPVETARKTGIPYKSNEMRKGLNLLSLGGYTLGGIFAVEYESSPIGPYREVAVLSGLVSKGLGIGAWASHIYVNSEDAAVYGRQFWGLPATTFPIEFRPSKQGKEIDKSLNSVNFSVSFEKDAIFVDGWNRVETCGKETSTERQGKGLLRPLDISLPSFSGYLPLSSGGHSDLLQYPLQINNPMSLSTSECTGNKVCDAESNSFGNTLKSLVESKTLFSVDVEGVNLTAGKPTVVN